MSYETYLGHITAYEREFGAWHRRVEKILKRYRADRPETDDTIKFNVLWSNVQTLKAATFARTPMPDVSRRFKDNDPAGRVAALLLERSLEFQVRHFRDYSATLQQVTYDRFLGGRGTAWIRYEMKSAEAGEEISEDAETDTPTGEQIEDENCPTDYVHWKDFGHQVARTWEEVNVVWRKVYLTKKQAEARFPKFDLPLDSSPDDNGREKRSDQDNIGKLALVYEIWAGLDEVIAAVMINYRDVDVVLVGGPECVILEAGWEKEPRVHLTCGKWSIRQSLAFIEEADLIIGPETGVLNAAANLEAPKIVFLSHSSVENLTRDWVNTTSLWGRETHCKGRGGNEAPACHMMHYGWDNCTHDKTSGTAQCQVDISVPEVCYHVQAIMDIRKKIKTGT